MHPPSEPLPADRAAAHSVAALEADVALRLSSSPAGTHDWSRSSSQPPNPIEMRMQTRSNATPEPVSDSDSGSDAFYGLQTEDDAPTSPTAPLAPFPPLPPPAARSRAPEFYGFVAATGTYLVFALYLLWAFLPDDAILALGVTWYPNREWSLLIPAYGMVLVLLTYFTYFALALAGTPSFADMRAITDSKAHLPASPNDADAAPNIVFNGDGHCGDTNSVASSTSALASNIDPADAPPAPEPTGSRSDGAHARTQSLLASSTPPPPQNSNCRPQPHPKPEPEPNFSTPTSTSQPTPKKPAPPKPKPKPSPYLAHARPDAIPELYDIPLGMVNRVVYGPRRTRTQS